MVISNPNPDVMGTVNNAGGGFNSLAHPSGIPQDQIDNIMSGIANTGDVKMHNHRKKLRQRFDIIKKLGQGTYGKVQLGIDKETGQEVAIKTIKKCKIEAEADLVRIRREVQIMSSVQHPNIIHIYEVFENREKMVLVMEFAAGGELYDYLSERKVLSEEESRRIFRQVATAVYYCHKHKICHRDLKLENILLDEHGNAKIADFGLSNVFDDQRMLATFCGSPLYASPEIVEGTPYQGPEVDCWSLGVLLYTLVYGSMPFDGSNFKRLVKQISQGDYYEPKKPSRASSLIRDMLTVCPRKRATIEQICSHWWVNENDNVSCLDLAEDLANQTPVRLDVLLSLTPVAITADQLVVPSADSNAVVKGNERVARSHSDGSIREIPANTEAERRIMDMVAAGGEAALMPSPTRTITPAQSPIQTKRKLETTVSTENALGALKKKEKPGSSSLVIGETTTPLTEEETPMETDDSIVEEPQTPAIKTTESGLFSQRDMEMVSNLCEQLIQNEMRSPASTTAQNAAPVASSEVNSAATSAPPTAAQQKSFGKLDAVKEAPEEKDATKVIKKFVSKHKTADLINAIGQISPTEKQVNEQTTTPTTTTSSTKTKASTTTATPSAAPPPSAPAPFVRKCSLQDDSTLNKFSADRRKSRILETAEKFAAMNAPNGGEKPKKLIIPGVSVGSYKKEFERKATMPTPQGPTAGEKRAMEQVAAAAAAAQELENPVPETNTSGATTTPAVESNESKKSDSAISLEEARRSMENSIALLRQAQNESSKEVDQLCAKTESIGVNDNSPLENAQSELERERKLQNARAIIGNAIQPVIRRDPTPPTTPQPFLGIGGGGYGQMRATNGGTIGYDNGLNTAGNITRTPSPLDMLPRTPLWPTAPNASNVALAAARQNIMGRLAAAGAGFGHNATMPTKTTQQLQQQINTNFIPTPISQSLTTQALPVQYTQKQQEHHPLYQQTLQQQCYPSSPQLKQQLKELQQQQQYQQTQNQRQNQFHRMFSVPNSFSYAALPAASAPVATAANANTSATINSVPKPFYNATTPSPATLLKSSPGGDPNAGTLKTSTASITLKSATLPRRKPAKTEIQLEIKPRIVEEQPSMRFTTEMQHPIADLRSAPAREGPAPFSPIRTQINTRATSLEPKEHIIPIQRPQTAYTRTSSNTTTRSGSLSRQSTLDSESDTTTTNMSQTTMTGSSQPIKKSPREFIIPIAIEGGGFITPREGSIEPSESTQTASSRSTFNRLRPHRFRSLLNDSGIDEDLPFQKIRTSSSNTTRDADDDGTHFTLHKLRSSRPVKKVSQDNDSQSSGEEDDDDDGFEILTAENLFSTLLQRVRALTNRMNTGNDFRGFPNSSRLLNNMRQAQSPFWNQEPFGRSQVSYSFSQTVEKKHVRLNNAANNIGGAPWRHSMSRDLGSDMDSMFSRTGATLPRGNKSSKTQRPTSDIASNSNDKQNKSASETEEHLDLADLDLSRLRLSKKDLETLSSITPGLPKCFQEQLLAKLPPTQARKLSRTLSMQNNPETSTIKVYKRSVSSGRGAVHEPLHDLRESTVEIEQQPLPAKASGSSESSERERSTSQIYGRSLSKPRYDYESGIPTPVDTATVASKSRSSSVCRDEFCTPRTYVSPYASEISDKYKYYSPYLNKAPKDSSTESGSVSPQKYTSLRNSGTNSSTLGRPPSGCISPPAIAADAGTASLHRRSSQRRISRFLRPDFFDEPTANDENPYQRERRQRERETQSVLREIREKSREPSRERLSQSSYECDKLLARKHSLPGEEEAIQHPQHMRNKSMDAYSDSQEAKTENRRSISRTRELSNEIDKHALADKILQELQMLSAARTQQENGLSVQRELSVERTLEIIANAVTGAQETDAQPDESFKEKTATIKKVKKVKPKEKSTESSTDLEAKITTSTVVKKVKKIVKKTESVKTPISTDAANIGLSTEAAHNSTTTDSEQIPKKESKLKRPKSYPLKEITSTTAKVDEPCNMLLSALSAKATPTIQDSQDNIELNNSSLTSASVSSAMSASRESRLMRPKSYPASKLTPPKDSKKITRSGAAIPSIAETLTTTPRTVLSEDNSHSATPTGDTSSSSDSRPTTIKKVIKVTKKSKLAQPTPVTPTTPIKPAEGSKESSPANVPLVKEKSPEKKPSKGLLYAIGQKFEKLRDSAMNKEKRNINTNNSSSTAIASTTKKSALEEQASENSKEKSTLLKKKKSLDGPTPKIDKSVPGTPNDAVPKTPRTPRAAGEKEKPVKTEKRSRIDAMIRSLRERSVPRSQPITTESNYIKRAVSVEEMPGTFNRNAVNKVLGLFKRFDKDTSERRVRSTRSTSNIERQIRESSLSPIYQNTKVEYRQSSGNLRQTGVSRAETEVIPCGCPMSPIRAVEMPHTSCPECIQNQAKALVTRRKDEQRTSDNISQSKEPNQGNKDKRKGLMLDLNKAEKMENNTSAVRSAKMAYINGNGLYSNLPPYPGAINSSSNNSSSQQSMDNTANNNNSSMTNNNSSSMHTSQTSGYRTSSAHEINRNHMLAPSTENIANYSSDSRSIQDDCASTSTFLSPTDEPELYFDNWSVCSEDNYMLHATPSPTVSRLSRASQLSSPTRCESSDPNESVIERIKRRSFYCRFNEKKPKRTSSIVGPSAVRDYYRDQRAAVKAYSSNKLDCTKERSKSKSPDITQAFFRPLKLSPAGTELKPPIYKSPNHQKHHSADYTGATTTSAAGKPRKSLNDIRTTASPSFFAKRFGSTSATDSDYLSLTSTVPTRIKSTSSTSPYESNGGIGVAVAVALSSSSSYYSTYNPKRRSSYTLNGTLPSGSTNLASSNIDGYATLGRRTIRPYDSRTISLLEPSTTSGISSYRRDARTPVRDYTSSISRTTPRYRTTSSTRSPTNI